MPQPRRTQRLPKPTNTEGVVHVDDLVLSGRDTDDSDVSPIGSGATTPVQTQHDEQTKGDDYDDDGSMMLAATEQQPAERPEIAAQAVKCDDHRNDSDDDMEEFRRQIRNENTENRQNNNGVISSPKKPPRQLNTTDQSPMDTTPSGNTEATWQPEYTQGDQIYTQGSQG